MKTPWYKRLWNWLCGKVKQWWTLTAADIKKDVLELINDPDLQSKALACVKHAAENGLKGNRAFKQAFNELNKKLAEEGKELRTHIKDTLIQNAYTVLRNTNETNE